MLMKCDRLHKKIRRSIHGPKQTEQTRQYEIISNFELMELLGIQGIKILRYYGNTG